MLDLSSLESVSAETVSTDSSAEGETYPAERARSFSFVYTSLHDSSPFIPGGVGADRRSDLGGTGGGPSTWDRLRMLGGCGNEARGLGRTAAVSTTRARLVSPRQRHPGDGDGGTHLLSGSCSRPSRSVALRLRLRGSTELTGGGDGGGEGGASSSALIKGATERRS